MWKGIFYLSCSREMSMISFIYDKMFYMSLHIMEDMHDRSLFHPTTLWQGDWLTCHFCHLVSWEWPKWISNFPMDTGHFNHYFISTFPGFPYSLALFIFIKRKEFSECWICPDSVHHDQATSHLCSNISTFNFHVNMGNGQSRIQ